MHHSTQAIAYLQAALHHLDRAKRDGEGSREIAVAYTEAETAIMWLDRDVAVRRGEDGHGSVFDCDYPMPDFISSTDLADLTDTERDGWLGVDMAKGEGQ